MGRMRSLWGVTPLLTLSLKARCDRLLGIQADSIVYTTYHTSTDFSLNLSSPTHLITKHFPLLLSAWCKIVFAWTLLHYDTFHYYYDRGILLPDSPVEPDQRLMIGINKAELDLLKKAGKKLYCFTYGADVRTRTNTLSLGEYNCCMDCPEPGKYCICSLEGSKNNIKKIKKYANAMLATTDNVNDVDGARIFHFWPIDTERVTYKGVTKIDGPLKIVHAPNHPLFKGTKYLESAVSVLKSEGLDIELHLLSGVSNDQVINAFSKADVIADQFITGGYGYTLLEGLARGKPVLCFLRNPDCIAAPEECPVIQTDPDNLIEILRWCINNRKRLQEIGKQGRNYILQHYSIPAVAERFGNLYLETGDFPAKTEDQLRRGIEKAKHAKNILISTENIAV